MIIIFIHLLRPINLLWLFSGLIICSIWNGDAAAAVAQCCYCYKVCHAVENWRKMILTAAQNYMSTTFQWTIWIFAHQHMIHCKYACIDRKVQQTISIMRFIDAHISTRHHKYLWFFYPHGDCCQLLPLLHRTRALFYYGKVRYSYFDFRYGFVLYFYAFALNVYLLKLDFHKLFFSISLVRWSILWNYQVFNVDWRYVPKRNAYDNFQCKILKWNRWKTTVQRHVD